MSEHSQGPWGSTEQLSTSYNTNTLPRDLFHNLFITMSRKMESQCLSCTCFKPMIIVREPFSVKVRSTLYLSTYRSKPILATILPKIAHFCIFLDFSLWPGMHLPGIQVIWVVLVSTEPQSFWKCIYIRLLTNGAVVWCSDRLLYCGGPASSCDLAFDSLTSCENISVFPTSSLANLLAILPQTWRYRSPTELLQTSLRTFFSYHLTSLFSWKAL